MERRVETMGRGEGGEEMCNDSCHCYLFYFAGDFKYVYIKLQYNICILVCKVYTI